MAKKILANYGWCQVIQHDNRPTLFYDKGGVVIEMIEVEINESDAKMADKSQIYAEELARKTQKEN